MRAPLSPISGHVTVRSHNTLADETLFHLSIIRHPNASDSLDPRQFLKTRPLSSALKDLWRATNIQSKEGFSNRILFYHMNIYFLIILFQYNISKITSIQHFENHIQKNVGHSLPPIIREARKDRANKSHSQLKKWRS